MSTILIVAHSLYLQGQWYSVQFAEPRPLILLGWGPGAFDAGNSSAGHLTSPTVVERRVEGGGRGRGGVFVNVCVAYVEKINRTREE